MLNRLIDAVPDLFLVPGELEKQSKMLRLYRGVLYQDTVAVFRFLQDVLPGLPSSFFTAVGLGFLPAISKSPPSFVFRIIKGPCSSHDPSKSFR